MTEQLRRALDTVASEVAQVDLTERVHRTSRRLARRRAAAVGTCAALLVGATVFTTARVFAAGDDLPVGAGNGSTSCVRADPRGPWVDPGDYATLTPDPGVDELLYLEKAPAPGAGVVRVVSWRPDMDRPVARCELPPEAVRTASVSPDGRWLAWVSTSDGALHVVDLTGREQDRTLRRGVDGERLVPVWSPDAKRLVVRDVSGSERGRVGTVDVRSGRFTPLRQDLPGATDLVWSADGTAIAFLTAEGTVFTAEPDGTRQRRVPDLDRLPKSGGRIVGLQSLSARWDGSLDHPRRVEGENRWLAVWVGAGPASEPLLSNTVVGTLDGKKAAMAGGIDDVKPFQVFFRDEPGEGARAHLLRRLEDPRAVELIGGNGEYFGGGREPAELGSYSLLGS